MKSDNKPPLTITREWLKEHDACKNQADLFDKIWPEGTIVTQETLTEAGRAGLSLMWLAGQVLSDSDYTNYRAEYGPLCVDYETNRILLDADYEAERALLNAVYETKYDTLNADFKAKRDALLVTALGTAKE